jgi:hypothetical protein
MLISKGADVNYKRKGISSLYLASSNGSSEVVKVLLANGATIEKKTIDVAKNEGNTEVVEILQLWPSIQMIPVFRESTGRHIDPGDIADLYEFMGEGKRKNKKSKKNKYKKSRKSIKKIK